MNIKDKVVEKLTGEPQPKEVLAVYKVGPNYSWIKLILDGKTIDVDESFITWDVDNKAKKTMAYITDSGNNQIQHISARIVGKKEYIQNLLYNIGMNLPDKKVKPHWKGKKIGRWIVGPDGTPVWKEDVDTEIEWVK